MGQKMLSATIAIGTPGYMPSEQAIGKPKPSSDIYALGVIAIQALTGLSPSPQLEDTDTGFRYDQTTNEIIWKDKVQVSSIFATILAKMVKYNSQERYASAVEALQALENLQSGYTPTVQASSPPYTPTRVVTSHQTRASQVPTASVKNSNTTRTQQVTSHQNKSEGSLSNHLMIAGATLLSLLTAGGISYLNSIRPKPQPTASSPTPSPSIVVASSSPTLSPIITSPKPSPTTPSTSPAKTSSPVATASSPNTAELEKQRQAELEKQRQAELEKQRQAELEKQRQAELEKQRQAELEKQRQAELERQRQAELERQRRTSQPASVSSLSDISPTDSYFQVVQEVIERFGFMEGLPDGTFRGRSAAFDTDFAFAQGRIDYLVATGSLSKQCVSDYSLEIRNITRYQLADMLVRLGNSCTKN